MTGVPALSVPYVAIEGCIGAGKTTVAQRLGGALGFQSVLERVDWNPFLDDLYRDPTAHAMQAMLTFLSIHFHQLQVAIQNQQRSSGILSDYLYPREAIFARAIVGQPHQQREWRIVTSVFEYFNERLPQPDLVVYLRASTELLLERIRSRGRSSEAGIDPAYVEDLNAAYEGFFDRYDGRLLVVNAADLDEDASELGGLVLSHL